MSKPTITIKMWTPPYFHGQKVGVIRNITVSDNVDLEYGAHIQFHNKKLGELQLSIDEARKLRDFLNKTLGD